ncbi:MAG: T9SS type A sorting domain-containing protein [Bacteroidales bacterium]|nr:T9SS type A sorting domain-containing protein [Bacteroidales bacterium]
MKTRIILTTVLVCVPMLLKAQWTSVNSGTTSNLFAMNFFNSTHGAIVGEDGLVLMTTDGGSTWADKSIPVTMIGDLFDVSMVNTTTAYVVGTSGIIYKTFDGGNTWAEQHWAGDLSPYRLYSVYFIDENKGWATGMGGSVINVTSASDTIWDDQTTSECFYWNHSIFFINENVGWVVGQYETIDKTTDGGQTWQGLHAATDPGVDFQEVFFINENKGWIGASDGEVWITEDGGENWTVKYISSNDLNTVFFLNENLGWIVGNEGQFYLSINGGGSWKAAQNMGTDVTFTDVHFFDENNGIVVGYNGTILATSNTGGLTNTVQRIKMNSPFSVYPISSSGCIRVASNNADCFQLEIFSMTGQILYKAENVQDLITVKIPAGAYIVKMSDKSGVYTEKIIAKN